MASGGSEDLFDELEGFIGVTLRTCTASVSIKDMAAAVEVVGSLTRRTVRLSTAVSKQSAAQVCGWGGGACHRHGGCTGCAMLPLCGGMVDPFWL